MANIVLLTQKEIPPGGSGMAQLFLADPVVTSWNQAFVIRSESPVVTIGGGRVLVPAADRIKRANQATLTALEELQSGNGLQRAAAAVFFAGTEPWSQADLSRLAGIDDPAAASRELLEQGELVELKISAQRHVIWHKDVLEELYARIEAALNKMHDREPLRSTVDRSRLAHQLSYCLDAASLDHLLHRMAKAKRVRLTDKGVGFVRSGPRAFAGRASAAGRAG